MQYLHHNMACGVCNFYRDVELVYCDGDEDTPRVRVACRECADAIINYATTMLSIVIGSATELIVMGPLPE